MLPRTSREWDDANSSWTWAWTWQPAIDDFSMVPTGLIKVCMALKNYYKITGCCNFGLVFYASGGPNRNFDIFGSVGFRNTEPKCYKIGVNHWIFKLWKKNLTLFLGQNVKKFTNFIHCQAF